MFWNILSPRTGPRSSWRTVSGGLNPKGHLFFAFSQEVLWKYLFYEQLDERTTFQQPFAASQIPPIQWLKTPPIIAMLESPASWVRGSFSWDCSLELWDALPRWPTGLAGKSELAMVACWLGSFCTRASHSLHGTSVAGGGRRDSVSLLTCDGVRICPSLYS